MPALRSSLTRLLGRRGFDEDQQLPPEMIGELDDRPQIELSWAAPDAGRDGAAAGELADDRLAAAFCLGQILIAEQLSFSEGDATSAETMRATVAGMWTATTARFEALVDAAPDGVLAALARHIPADDRTALLVEHACAAPFADPGMSFDADDLRTAVRRIGAILRVPEGRIAEVETAHRASELAPRSVDLDADTDLSGGVRLATDPDAIDDLDLAAVRDGLAKLRITLSAARRDDDGAELVRTIRDGLGERRSGLEAALVAERLLDEPDTTRRDHIATKLVLVSAVLEAGADPG